jgi:hypothetical protein
MMGGLLSFVGDGGEVVRNKLVHLLDHIELIRFIIRIGVSLSLAFRDLHKFIDHYLEVIFNSRSLVEEHFVLLDLKSQLNYIGLQIHLQF